MMARSSGLRTCCSPRTLGHFMRRDFIASIAMAMIVAWGSELVLAGSASAVGVCRDPVKCPCTDEDKKKIAKEIEGLKGRLHQLSEANRLLQKQMHEAENK